MKEIKTARMRNGHGNRKLYTIYYYNGWYTQRGGRMVGYCGDSSYIRNGGNMVNIPDFDVFNLASGCVNNMNELVKLIKEHCNANE